MTKIDEVIEEARKFHVEHPVWDKAKLDLGDPLWDRAYFLERKRYLVNLSELEALSLTLTRPKDAYDRIQYVKEGEALQRARERAETPLQPSEPLKKRFHRVEKNYKPWL